MNRARRTSAARGSRLAMLVLLVLAGSLACGGWLSPDPRRLLESSAEACRTIGAVRYAYTYEGRGSLAGSFRGQVTLSRLSDGGKAFRASITGRLGAGDERARVDATIASDGRTATRIDAVREVFWHGSAKGGGAHLLTYADRAVLFQLLEERPYAEELDLGGLARVGAETVGGVPCDVVRGRVDDQGGAEVRWSIGKTDHLPRALEWKLTGKGAAGAFRFEIEGLEGEAEPGPEEFVLSPPVDYPSIDEDLRIVDVGAAAPDWTLQTGSGDWVTLSSLRGEVVVLDFWASWCPPCRASMPEIDEIARRREGEPVRFLAVNTWENPDVDPRAVVVERAPGYELLLRGETIAADYKISTLPALFVIDRDGSIAFVAKAPDAQPARVAAQIDEAVARALAGAAS